MVVLIKNLLKKLKSMEENQNIQADIARNHEDSASSPFPKDCDPSYSPQLISSHADRRKISLQERKNLKLAFLQAGCWTRLPEVPSSQNNSVTLFKHLIESKAF